MDKRIQKALLYSLVVLLTTYTAFSLVDNSIKLSTWYPECRVLYIVFTGLSIGFTVKLVYTDE